MGSRWCLALVVMGALWSVQASSAWAGPQEDLVAAAANGRLDKLQSALARGARLDQQDGEGYTALIWAAQHGRTEAVRALLQTGANPDLVDKGGYSALIWAAQEGHLDAVKELLAGKANPQLRDARGFRALELARAARHDAIVTVLTTPSRVATSQAVAASPSPTPVVAQSSAPVVFKPIPVISLPPTPSPQQLKLRAIALGKLQESEEQFAADFKNYVDATAANLGWRRMATLNDPDLEMGRLLAAFYANLRKDGDLKQARNDWRKANLIQESRGESLFETYLIDADKALSAAGF
jgi:hypothetical protein